jgi:propanediol dehydratase small subunit
MKKEKLTEKINAITVTKSLKDNIIKIADNEEIQIQQVCRKLLSEAIKNYFEKKNLIKY